MNEPVKISDGRIQKAIFFFRFSIKKCYHLSNPPLRGGSSSGGAHAGAAVASTYCIHASDTLGPGAFPPLAIVPSAPARDGVPPPRKP